MCLRAVLSCVGAHFRFRLYIDIDSFVVSAGRFLALSVICDIMRIFCSVSLRCVLPLLGVSGFSGIPEITPCLQVPFYVDPHGFMRCVCCVLPGVIFRGSELCSTQLVLSVGFLVRFMWAVKCIGDIVVAPALCPRGAPFECG